MRPHPVLAVAADQADIARGTLTLAYLYRQLGMATRTGCKTIAGCLILLQIWIYEYFPAFRPNLRQADMPNKTRAEMWSPQKPIRELSRLRDCRSILDAMIETQVEWTPYMTSARALLNEHPRIAYIGGITCFDVVEVYLPERTVRQLGFAQDIPPPPLRPTQAVRPAQGSYSVTFSSSPMFTEMWSRFPYCARVVEQALRRTSVPSEAGPDYVDWFRVSSHCFLIPGEGPAAAFGVADNRVKYFAAEYSARLAPLLRMPAIAQMTPRKRDVADMYLDDLRELFAEWQQCRGRSP
ncbi:protein MAIN-LIKE 2-like [Amaranthus tricolor]|nr:protein MAIN-LIKE 2-like [Amaranthus tricolor]XP_057529405.1 protein MAIN-LIKE 2-like [Amaranthus tricolor]XP_057529406.1 protein MAIN-LIKE 2-like [Amaranthus tricolor]XP_057529407.1 protein MAIN-LIKE 2-like [Amaranthus tricolor]XP_057529408.1 protein MAIN-LIKE 2-like [Amaranthus tricolor]